MSFEFDFSMFVIILTMSSNSVIKLSAGPRASVSTGGNNINSNIGGNNINSNTMNANNSNTGRKNANNSNPHTLTDARNVSESLIANLIQETMDSTVTVNPTLIEWVNEGGDESGASSVGVGDTGVGGGGASGGGASGDMQEDGWEAWW